MTLLLALIAVAAYFAMPESWRSPLSSISSRWLAWAMQLPIAVGLRLTVAVVAPVLVVLVAGQLLDELLSLFLFMFYALVVVAIFGDNQATASINQQQADWDGKEWPSDDELLENALSLARQHRLRSQLNELFAPLFWLILATPVAALAYYLLRKVALHDATSSAKEDPSSEEGAEKELSTEADAEEESENLAVTCLHIADWLPSRLLALSLALAGNFSTTWGVIRERFMHSEATAYELVDAAADAAEPIAIDPSLTPDVGLAAAMHQLDSVLLRALVVWMVFLALKTLWPGM